MGNIRRSSSSWLALFAGGVLLIVAPVSTSWAGDKVLGETEIYKLESASKDFVIDLVVAGVWKKGDDQLKQFYKYTPHVRLAIPKFDEKANTFLERDTFSISGAEYRHALAAAKAFASYSKLDDEGKTRVDLEFFGAEARPARGTARYEAGVAKVKRLLEIIRGEPYATMSREQVELDAAYRLVMESRILDRDTKAVYKALHNVRLLSDAEKAVIERWGKDPSTPEKVTAPDGKVLTVTGSELQEDFILIKAVLNTSKLAGEERKALNRKLHGHSDDARDQAEKDRDIERVEKGNNAIKAYTNAHR